MANALTNFFNTLLGGGGNNSQPAYESAAEAEARRQAKVDAGLKRIEEVFGKYDQDFYDRSQDAYLDYYEPQLEDKYKKGLQDLKFALARGGRFGSSTEVDRKAKAAQDMGFQKQELASGAIQAADASEAAVNAAKKEMTNLNQINANPDLAASLSNQQAAVLNQPAKYDPLLDVFGNITEGLAKREEIENRRKIRDQINLWEQGGGSGKIVR